MALVKSTLSSALEAVLTQKPGSRAEAAQGWAQAYAAYAASAMSSLSSLATNATANAGILIGAFSGALEAEDPSGAAGQMSAGVMGFWAAIVWVGPSAAGSTASPGNTSLQSDLQSIFEDLDGKSDAEKASALADAFDSGATQVMVADVPFAPPNVPVVAPIS